MSKRGMSGWMFLLVPAHPGSLRQMAIKRSCVCQIPHKQINSTYKLEPALHTRQSVTKNYNLLLGGETMQLGR